MPAKPRTFKRSGLHKLECPDCAGYVYATVAQLETHGMPACPCGAVYVPDELELAGLLGIDAPSVAEYQRECDRIAHGQTSHGIRGRELRSVESIALERIAVRRRESARARRIAAIMPKPEPMPF